MKHRKWIRNIHLLRNNELNHKEQLALNTHLSQCEDCKAMYERLQLDWVSVIGEVSQEPELGQPERLTRAILSQINPAPGLERTLTRSHKFDILETIFHPHLRVGMQLATLALLGIFLVEQVQITNSIRNLEAGLNVRAGGTAQARFSVIPQTVKKRVMLTLQKQLEKRGLPAKRLESYILRLEAQSSPREFMKIEENSRRVIEKWSTKNVLEKALIDRLKDWRQP